MSAPVEIVNKALLLIGVTPITALTDANKNARTMQSLYDITRRSEIRTNLWSFAMVRASLAALASTPAHTFLLEYQLPTDCLRVFFVGDYYVGASITDYRTVDESPYAIEARKILTDLAAPLKIRYVRDVEDTNLWDALFTDAFAHRLAIDACEDLTGETAKRDRLERAYSALIQTAARVNAIERPPEPMPDDSWILSRH